MGLLIDHGVVGCVIIAVLQIQVMHHIKEKRRLASPLVCLTFLQDIHMEMESLVALSRPLMRSLGFQL